MSAKLPTDDEIRALLAPVREQVMDATREIRSPRRSTRYRTGRNIVLAGIAGLALSAGAVLVVANQADVRTTVTCFEDTDRSSKSVLVQASYTDSPRHQIDPVIYCQEAWQTGILGQPEPVDPDDNKTFPVPPLVACVQANGVGAAFPNRDDVPAEKLCESLGLAEWDPEAGV